METKEEQLIEFTNLTKKVAEAKEKVAEYDKMISVLEIAFETPDSSAGNTVLVELHNLRLAKLQTLLQINEDERKMLKFELEAELAD